MRVTPILHFDALAFQELTEVFVKFVFFNHNFGLNFFAAKIPDLFAPGNYRSQAGL